MSATLPRPRLGVVLAAHGDGNRSVANRAVHTLARALEFAQVADQVVAGFHSGAPSFRDAFDRLDTEQVLVVPFMASAGYYATHVLPRALPPASAGRPWTLTAPVGAHPAVVPLVAGRVERLLRRHDLAPAETTLVVVGHGTSRSADSRTTAVRIARALEDANGAQQAVAAFLDDEPSVETVVDTVGSGPILVVPLLIGGGHHTLADLPRRLGIVAGASDGAGWSADRRRRTIVLDAPIGRHPAMLGIVADLIRAHTAAAGEPTADAAPRPPRLSYRPDASGCVYLVGAGPGDPELVTVRGRRLIETADVLVTDRLVAPELIARASPGTEIIDVGKRLGGGARQDAINRLLVDRARSGQVVVRLKGGDPFVFARGGEEADACRQAAVAVAVVPGVTSAIAVPAAAGIPVTDRGVSASFAVITPLGAGGHPIDVTPFAAVETLVVLMVRHQLGLTTRALIASGRDPETPAAAIQEGTTPRQRAVTGTLATIEDAVVRAGLQAPMVLVIGAVAARAGRRSQRASTSEIEEVR